MSEHETFFPLEFFIQAVPLSLRASSANKERWKKTIAESARQRRRETDELGFLDSRPVAVSILYFPSAPMEGDIDNIVKPILDALIGVTYLNDKAVERIVSQKFGPDIDWTIADPSVALAEALECDPPILYIRIDDDLGWRHQ